MEALCRGQGEMDERELRRKLLSCIDGTLKDAMYDALGNKINTSTEAAMITEYGKLAVNEQFTMEEIIAVVEDMYMIHEEIPVKQPNHHSSLAKQTPPRIEDPALTQMLSQQGLPRPSAGGSTEKVYLYTIPARRQTQLMTEEGQLTITVEEVLDSTPNMQMTIISTELFRGGQVTTLQEVRSGYYQCGEGQVCANLVGKPGPALQTVDATVDDAVNAAADVDDNPLNEINAGNNRTVEEAAITTPEVEPSTNSGGGSGNYKTVLATIRDEIIKLGARMMMLETNQSYLLTRLLELDAKPLSVKTTEPSEPAAANDGARTEKTTQEPGSIEPCANAAIADRTNYEASNVARTGTKQLEVIREITTRQNMKQPKASTLTPKNRTDQVQRIQPMTRGSNEIKLSVRDRFHEPAAMIKIRICLFNEDSVTFKSLSLVPTNKPLDQSHKYEQTTVGIKPLISRAFIKDNFHHLTIIKSTHGSDNLPLNISISQLESATKEEDADDKQGNKAIDDHGHKYDPTIDENITHPRMTVGENYEPKVNIVKEVVEECCMVEDLEGAEEHHWWLGYNEIANFMKEYRQLTKEPSVVDDTATPSADYPLAETGVDEARHVDGEHPGEHDDQPLVRLLGDLIKMKARGPPPGGQVVLHAQAQGQD
jgi:hypothetical protein